MNKKLLLGMFATAGVLFATSCSHEDLIEPVSGETSTVSFVVNTEDALATRAIGDGSNVDRLYYAVWDSSGKNLKYERVDIQGGSKTLNLTLAKGQTYTLGFWAGKANWAGIHVGDNFKMTAEGFYEGNNDVDVDAFTAHKTYTVSGNDIQTVTLKRPFAQINVGVTEADYEAAKTAGIEVKDSKVELKGTFGNKFNIVTGEVMGWESNPVITLRTAPIPDLDNNTLQVAGNDYKYISTCYVLPARIGESQLVDAKFTFSDTNTHEIVLEDGVSNLPIKSNYRTNIIGNVLTSNVDFEVVVDKEFDGEHNTALWDGSSVSSSFTADAEGRLHIKSAEDFALLMSSTRQQNSAYIGKTFVLDTDIDFAGQTITGVGSEACNFAGTFDGNGHTISNFVIDQSGRSFYGGLFCQMTTPNSAVKNLTVKGATVIAQKMAGVIASSVESGAVVENCHVENCVVIAKVKKAGAITGYTAGGTVKNCSAKNVEVYCADPAVAESDEIVGYENTGSTVADNTADNVNVYRGTNTIATAAELVEFFNGRNVGNSEKYVLISDIDLQGQAVSGVLKLYGTFDGNGHTISNVVVNKADNVYCAGLFNFVSNGGLVKNLTVKNASISGWKIAGVIAGGVYGGVIDACHVENSTVIARVKKAGSVAGYVESGTVKNCSAKYVSVYTADPTEGGALVGFAQPGSTLTGNTAEDHITVVCGADLVISTAAELVAFANDVNNDNTYIGKTVVLAKDIDLAGIDWTPIGGPGAELADPFYGTFDGLGHTIKNLRVVEKPGADVYDAIGFFGWLDGFVKNLNFEDAYVEGHHDVAVVAGYLVGSVNGQIKDVTVNRATVKATYLNGDRDGDKAGAIVGFHNGGHVKATVTNSSVEAVRDAGYGIGCTDDFANVNVTALSTTVTVNGVAKDQIVGRTL